ncbi:hypothetical protein PENFLA_c022G00387 [Penicillium flavigenum]|uniref:Uncharacterized protein n=1 Tax=Penicillium flavigenum TaxID=254877 RepID=A0A1V6SVV6_9EURO|nr:hypothetical protein PENFLA_c022G00387 [Penicillium flavigenum]
MVDPFSVASGAVGLLSLGIEVTQGLVSFYTAWKNQDVTLARTAESLEFLLGILQALDTAIRFRQSQPNERNLLQKVERAILGSAAVIQDFKDELRKFVESSSGNMKERIKISGRRAAYPFKRGTLLNIEDSISEIRENLSFALEVLHVKDCKTTQDEISGLKLLVDRISENQISSTICDWLMAPDATVNHNAACVKRHAETGSWFINSDDFTSWSKTSRSFLWVNGFAGCGKSVLCSIAIQHTFQENQSKDGVGIAFFYFDFSDTSKQSASGMLRALLLQLARQLKGSSEDIRHMHALHKSGSPSVATLLVYLQRILQRFCHCYIFLDALDECPRYHEREGVLTAIRIIRGWCFPGLHLLVTSRDEFDIRESVNPKRGENIIMKNAEIDKDISSFVHNRLKNDPRFKRWKERHNEIQNALTKHAQAVFRYVECQLNGLQKARTEQHLQYCLNSLPRDLDETYERLLCSIDEMYIDDVRQIMTMLCFSKRPLALSEIVHAHALGLGQWQSTDPGNRLLDIDDLREICVGLIEIESNEYHQALDDPVVYISHFSVREYLVSDRIRQQKAAAFALQSGPAHTEITRICLTYLVHVISKIEPQDMFQMKPRQYPLGRFAAEYWFHHYKNSGCDNMHIEELVLRLFSDMSTFSKWTNLYDFDRPRNASIRPNDQMGSPLYYASMLGLIQILDRILSNGFDVNIQGGALGSSLQAASLKGYEQIVQLLLDRGADVNALGGRYGNTLQAASWAGHSQVVQILVDRGAHVNFEGGRFGNSLRAASREGHHQVVPILLDHGADVNGQGGGYGTALYAALQKGHKKVAQILLNRGADVNVQGGEYGNALRAASWEGHEDVVQLLLDGGADVNLEGGYFGNALQTASWKGHGRIVQILLDRGADINARCGRFGSALQAALSEEHEEVVQILKDRGANISAQGGKNINELEKLPCEDHMGVVQVLSDRGGNFNTDEDLGSALRAASLEGHEKVVEMLLNRGADVNAQGGEFGNPLQAASCQGHDKVVQILLDRGADMNTQCGRFGNALHAAFSEGHEEVMQMLLDRGARY